MLSRPCQHSNDWQHWAKRPRHTPRCSRSPRCSAALVSMGNDWQHWAEWTKRGLAYKHNIASRHTQESHRRDLCCVLAPSAGAAIFSPIPCSSQRRTCKACKVYPHLLCPTPQATTSHQESCCLPRSAQAFFTAASTCVFSQIDTLCNCIGRQSWTSVLLEIREEQKSAALNTLSHWSIWPCSRINESGVEREASRKRSVQVQLLIDTSPILIFMK